MGTSPCGWCGGMSYLLIGFEPVIMGAMFKICLIFSSGVAPSLFRVSVLARKTQGCRNCYFQIAPLKKTKNSHIRREDPIQISLFIPRDINRSEKPRFPLYTVSLPQSCFLPLSVLNFKLGLRSSLLILRFQRRSNWSPELLRLAFFLFRQRPNGRWCRLCVCGVEK